MHWGLALAVIVRSGMGKAMRRSHEGPATLNHRCHESPNCRLPAIVKIGLLLCARLGRFSTRPRHALGRTSYIHAGAITSGDFRIDPAQDHSAAIERNEFAVLRPRGISGRTDIILAAR